MLSKMGWSEGKGLGASEDGTVEHIKVVKRKVNLGLGSKTNHSENWIAHQEDFNDLLANLNQNKSNDGCSQEPKERPSLKSSVKQSKKKIFYSKFINSKDLSLKSKNDLACVMGQRSKSTPSTPQDLSEDEGAKSDTSVASCPAGTDKESSIVTTNSQMNLQEYFAQKMAAMRKKKDTSPEVKDINEEEVAAKDVDGIKKKKKKSKKDKKEERVVLDEDSDCVDEETGIVFMKEKETVNEDSDNLQERTVPKKKKKSKKSKRNEDSLKTNLLEDEDSSTVVEKSVDLEEKAKKKRKRDNEEKTDIEEINDSRKKKKKDKKRKNKETEDSKELIDIDANAERASKKKKRKIQQTI